MQGAGLSKTTILATAKHFVADGGTLWGTGDSGYQMDQAGGRPPGGFWVRCCCAALLLTLAGSGAGSRQHKHQCAAR